MDEQGNYVFNISHMLPKGSYHGNQAANYQQLLHEGKMAMALSSTRGSQKLVTLIHFDQQGNAIIPKDSFAAQSLFENHGGHAQYNGAYAEAVQLTGTNAKGETTMRMLATVVGKNQPKSGTDTITRTITENHERVITSFEMTAKSANPIEIPFVLPFYGRRGLENLATPREKVIYNQQYSEFGFESEEDIEDFIEDVNPIIKQDPRAIVPMDKATEGYSEVLDKHYGEDYAAKLREEIKASPVLSSIDGDTKAILAIPVESTGEADKIYDTLALYAASSPEDLKGTKFILHLNTLEGTAATPEGQAAIQKTRDEIARAVADHPGLQVHILESTWTQEQKEQGGGLIGYAVRKMYDLAILSSSEAVRDGRITPDQEIVLIRNDADPNGIHRGYLGNMTKAVADPTKDGAVGKFKWGVKEAADFPGFNFVTQFMSGLANVAARNVEATGGFGWVGTSGANTAIRISTLASIGSVGFGKYTGAGSDDQALGRRVRAARNVDSVIRRRLSELHGESGEALPVTWSQLNVPLDGTTIGGATGSTIDTDGSRLKRMYLTNKPIANAWVDYDGRTRDEGLDRDAPPESLETEGDVDGVMGRIEYQINSLIELWGYSGWQLEIALKQYLPTPKGEEDEPLYEVFLNPNGVKNVRFTPKGKAVLARRLTHTNSGKIDPIGERRMRVNYGKSNRGNVFPAGRTPLLVGKPAMGAI
jgi:hypothetical protein